MITRIVIPGRYPGLNDFIDANRRKHGKWSRGNTMKQENQQAIMRHLPHGVRFRSAVSIRYHFYEPNKRRDKDNVSGYFHKIFQDALVMSGMLRDDGWDDILEMSDSFSVDRKNPRIEVEIEEEQ